jgi:hypothetical protein
MEIINLVYSLLAYIYYLIKAFNNKSEYLEFLEGHLVFYHK